MYVLFFYGFCVGFAGEVGVSPGERGASGGFAFVGMYVSDAFVCA